MKFVETDINQVHIIELEKLNDERGYFSRAWDEEIFRNKRLNEKIIQCNISFNKVKGTLRGLHYQSSPYEEAKLIRCTKGEVYEIVLDLRKKSNSYKKWQAFRLTEDELKLLYVPEGCAVGFQTLVDNTELFYQMSQKFMPEFSRGVRWNDPLFKINWPLPITCISEKDNSWKDFQI